MLYSDRPPHSHYNRHIKANMTHILSICTYPQEAITKYYTHLHHTLAALERYFPASLVATLPNSEQINLPSSNDT